MQADLRGQPTSTSAVSGRLLKEARRAIDAANTLQQKRESCKRKLQELLDSQLFDLSMTRPRHVHDMSIARAQELLDSHATDAAVLRNRIELAEGMGVVGDALRELKQRLAAALQQARRRPRAGGHVQDTSTTCPRHVP